MRSVSCDEIFGNNVELDCIEGKSEVKNDMHTSGIVLYVKIKFLYEKRNCLFPAAMNILCKL